jgi:DNA mismatch endonuclease, patch repair protein
MRKIQAKNTSPEMAVRRLAHGMGFRYRLHSSKLPGRPDLAFMRLKKIVEVRGCFWHQHGGCIDSHIPKSRRDYWVPKLKRNQDRDAENLQRLKALGFRVLTVWECEVKDEKRLVTKLGRFLNR